MYYVRIFCLYLLLFRGQHSSVDDVDDLNQLDFEDRDHMNEADLYSTNDIEQCSLLFNHDDRFYDTLINETSSDLEKNTLSSDEETDKVTDTLCSTDDEESVDENEIDAVVEGNENEIDVIVEGDENDNEQTYELYLSYCKRKSFLD
jgi:hypothetical protein